jgi:alpha-1,2-mannosyltransferase
VEAVPAGGPWTAVAPVVRRVTPVGVIIACTAAVAAALRFYQLARPGYLFGVTQYDDGVYFGSAVRFVHGALPYRDFVSVQPPGIIWLMTPVALATKAMGTAWGLAVARVLTVCADTASVVLVGLLVRHRGILAVTAACGILAVYPETVGASSTLMLEPWLNLFCLISALAAFDGEMLAGRKRLLWAGVAVGFAGTIKIWAIAPALVLVALCATQRRKAPPFLAGAAAGFLIPVLPLALLAPTTFFNGVFVAQFSRAGIVRVSAWTRLEAMAGLTNIGGANHGVAALVLFVIVALVGITCARASIIAGRPPPALELFALATTVLVALMLLLPAQYFHHYTSFLGPFLAISIALPPARLATARWAAVGAAIAAAIVCAMALVQFRAEAALHRPPRFFTASSIREVPRGACVLTDMVSMTISANRFVSNVPGCPLIVDTTGTDYTLSGGRNGWTGAAASPAVRQVWQDAFAHAQYIWLSGKNRKWIPWTHSLVVYFDSHFVRMRNRVITAPTRLFVRKELAPPPSGAVAPPRAP